MAASVETVDRTSSSASVEELRSVFRQGLTPAAAARLLRAREEGVDWETATRAVAEGVATCFQATPQTVAPVSPRRGTAWLALPVGLLAYVLVRPLLGLGHELAVAGIALSLHALVASNAWVPAVAFLSLDPVYAGAAIHSIGGVDVRGLAVAGDVGTRLHAWLPSVFLSSRLVVHGAGTSMVAGPGSTVLGRGLAGFGADVIWLAVAVALFLRARRLGKPSLAVFALLVQAQIALNHLLDVKTAVRDLDASGLPFALSLLTPAGGPGLVRGLKTLPSSWQEPIVGVVLLGVAYATVGMALVTWRGVRSARGWLRRAPEAPERSTTRPLAIPLRAGMAIAIIAAVSPIGAMARGYSNWQKPGAEQAVAAVASFARLPLAGSPIESPAGPSLVRLEQSADSGWRYTVNGEATVIRGVGYNPQYAALPSAQRATLYDRDFQAMRSIGINTIEGWFENQFDEVTLDHAAEAGLGVLVPFELNQDWSYDDPQVRAQILERITAWVERYKDKPAVRMWAPGNEDMHRILFPRWVSQEQNPVARARADAFAAFLPVLVDRIHALDPNHPVVYRDAEDVYLPRLKAAFERTRVSRPWLVYGANVYTLNRLRDLIGRWPNQWVGGPLLISEFAPGGVGPAERGLGYRQYWEAIRSRPNLVIGGLAYTWATNGPEDLDRVFGLVDSQGLPVDGGAAALGAAYLADSGPPRTP